MILRVVIQAILKASRDSCHRRHLFVLYIASAWAMLRSVSRPAPGTHRLDPDPRGHRRP